MKRGRGKLNKLIKFTLVDKKCYIDYNTSKTGVSNIHFAGRMQPASIWSVGSSMMFKIRKSLPTKLHILMMFKQKSGPRMLVFGLCGPRVS